MLSSIRLTSGSVGNSQSLSHNLPAYLPRTHKQQKWKPCYRYSSIAPSASKKRTFLLSQVLRICGGPVGSFFPRTNSQYLGEALLLSDQINLSLHMFTYAPPFRLNYPSSASARRIDASSDLRLSLLAVTIAVVRALQPTIPEICYPSLLPCLR